MWRKIFTNPPVRVQLFILLLAFCVRLYGVHQPAQVTDMNTFQAWGSHLLAVGPVHFFEDTWSDYLPLPLYFLAPISTFSTWTSLPFGLVFKSVVSLLELTLVFVIIQRWKHRGKLLILALLALSPALISDSAFWGQLDTIPALLTLLSFVLLYNWPATVIYYSLLFGLAVAIKPIMVLVAPIIWILGIKRGEWWQFPLISSLAFLLTAVPMAGLGAPNLLWERTLAQTGTYQFTTINAWNIWSVVPSLSAWIPDNTTIIGLSGHTAGLLLFLFAATLTLFYWSRTNWHPRFVFRVAGTILIAFFVFTTRMHERHLLFGLPFLTLAIYYESWLGYPLLILTTTFLLNLYFARYWLDHGQVWLINSLFVSLISWINTLIAFSLAAIWHWPTFLTSTISQLKTHKYLVLILILATLLRFVNLGHPPVYIFDEVYHAFTAREYLHNHIEAWEWWTTPPEDVAYEWTHPPLAKYGMVLGMLLFGENSFGWRVGSATFGVISILGLYLLVLTLTKKKNIALLSALLLSIEGLHIAQSRIAMNDIYMLAFYIWALYAATKSRWKISAILYGLALASKWSALYGVIPLAFIYLHSLKIRFSSTFVFRHLLSILRLLLISLFVYVLTFTPFILTGHSWEQFLELHRQMWYYHTHLVATHAYQSTPWQWIFAARPVWYYVDYADNLIAHIYAQGNPLIYWLGLFALISGLKRALRFPHSLLLLLYLIFTLPWIFSPRIMFFYHYLPSATFLCVILSVWISHLTKRWHLPIVVLCILGLLMISPMLFAIPMSTHYWDSFFTLLPSWK